jgi:hypothetical protein
MHASNAFEVIAMAMLTVRNLSEEVHRALRVRAAQHGQSMEAEVREILESAISPKGVCGWVRSCRHGPPGQAQR